MCFDNPRRHPRMPFSAPPDYDDASPQSHSNDASVRSKSPDMPIPKKERIRVVVRKRPLKYMECQDVVACGADTVDRAVTVNETRKRLDLSEYNETHTFHFDESYGERDSTEAVYRGTARPLCDAFLTGQNASCFAYGQTGSGKTHTMLGDGAEAGMYVLAARDIYDRLPPGFEIRAACFEIYCEKLYDLTNARAQVYTREDAGGVVNICGLTTHMVRNQSELMQLMAESTQYRAQGSTSANAQSSRSHAVLKLHLHHTGDDDEICSFTFVDLAGSERGQDTAGRDQKTRREGCEINKSLLALKECIRGLDSGHKHIKFRGSKLTEVLKGCFTGRSRSVMIATVSPSQRDVEHSMNTLRYAHRVKQLPPVKVSSVGRKLSSRSLSHHRRSHSQSGRAFAPRPPNIDISQPRATRSASTGPQAVPTRGPTRGRSFLASSHSRSSSAGGSYDPSIEIAVVSPVHSASSSGLTSPSTVPRRASKSPSGRLRRRPPTPGSPTGVQGPPLCSNCHGSHHVLQCRAPRSSRSSRGAVRRSKSEPAKRAARAPMSPPVTPDDSHPCLHCGHMPAVRRPMFATAVPEPARA